MTSRPVAIRAAPVVHQCECKNEGQHSRCSYDKLKGYGWLRRACYIKLKSKLQRVKRMELAVKSLALRTKEPAAVS